MINSIGLFVARAWSQLAATVLFVVAARVLTHDDVGVFALASALTMVLTQWVGVGAYEYVIRERVEADAEHTAFWINIGVAAVLALVGVGIAAGSGYWFETHELPPVILALAPLTLPAGCRSAVEAVLVRDGKLTRLAFSTTLVETFSLAAGVVALLNGFGLWALVVHKWCQTTGAAVVFAIVARWTPRCRFDVQIAHRMRRFGAGIFGDRFLSFFQNYGVDIFLGVLLNPSAVALFRVAARLVTACVTIITEPMRQLNWKLLADALHEGRPVPRTAEGLIGAMTGLMAGPMIGLAVTADLVVGIVLGERWASSARVVQLLALAALISTPQLLTEAALGVQSKTRWLPLVRAGGVVTLMAMLLLFGHNGPEGAAIGQLIAAVALSLAATAIQWRLVGIRPGGYLGDVAAYLVAGGAMAGGVLGWRWLATQAHWPDIVTLATSVTVGGACYLGVAALLRRRRAAALIAELRAVRAAPAE